MAKIHPITIQRFHQKIRKTSRCWLWTGGTTRGGYGAFSFSTKMSRKTFRAHRLSWEIHRGKIPSGIEVCHNCPGGDNPLCVNPSHLWLGTRRQNFDDMMKKGRHCKGEKYRSAKLNDRLVRTMRRLFADGESANSIARRFAPGIGANVSVVRWAITGKTWKHVV